MWTRHLLALLLLSLSPLSAQAYDMNPISIDVISGSNCSRAVLDMSLIAHEMNAEYYRVTTSNHEFDFSSPIGAAQQSDITGSTIRTVNFPQSARADSLVALSYQFGNTANEFGTGNFFALYSCTGGSLVYSCVGYDSSCPVTIDDYLPHLSASAPSIRFGRTSSKEPQTSYIELYNQGRIPVEINSITIEGPDAESFTTAKIEPFTIEAQGSQYGTVRLNPKRAKRYQATLRISATDPGVPDLLIPISANLNALPHLTVKIGEPEIVEPAINGVYSASVTVTNRGFKKAPAGALLQLVESPSGEDDKSARRLLINRKLPALKPGKAVRYTATSNHHDFTFSMSKYLTARLLGETKQVGTGFFYEELEEISYVYFSPKQ